MAADRPPVLTGGSWRDPAARYVRRCQRMVDRQLRGHGIVDPTLLDAFLRTPRHLFVDEALSERAYGDASLPIGCGQRISQPYIAARMIQLLDPRPDDRILEIGTGSGYQAAILSRLAGAIYTVERLQVLAARARENWRRAEVGPIALLVGDGSLGWPERAPFSAVLVSAAAPVVPHALLRQLALGGRMVIPVGSAGRQTVRRLVRTETGARVEECGRCSFVRLIGQEGFAE